MAAAVAASQTLANPFDDSDDDDHQGGPPPASPIDRPRDPSKKALSQTYKTSATDGDNNAADSAKSQGGKKLFVTDKQSMERRPLFAHIMC